MELVMTRLALRRYNRSVLMLSAAYALILFGVITFFKNGPPTGVSAYAAAILPALPIIGIFAAIGRYLVEEPDEYVRMLMVRQTLWASAFALSLVAWFGGRGLGACINRLTLGASGRC